MEVMKRAEIAPADKVTVTYFEGWRETAKGECTFAKFINAVKGEQKSIEKIKRLWTLDKECDEYNAIKEKLPCILVSCRGVMGKTSRFHDNTPTGLFCVDIDGKENKHITDWGGLRSVLGKLDYVYLSALSAGGKGIYLIIAVDPTQPHEETYKSIEAYFKDKFCLTIDHKCSNINRFRVLSYDPQAVAKTPTTHFKAPLARFAARDKQFTTKRAKTLRNDLKMPQNDRVAAYVQEWIRQGIELEDYDEWFQVAAFLHNHPRGEEYFHAMSGFSPKYKRPRAEKEWKNSERFKTAYRINTLIHFCHRHGVVPPEWKKREKAKEDLKDLIAYASSKEGAKLPSVQATNASAKLPSVLDTNATSILPSWAHLYGEPNALDLQTMNPDNPPPQYAPF